MGHVVINKFKDRDKQIYEVGKPYPAKGKATQKRLDELSAVHKRYKVAFIEDDKVEPDSKTVKEEPKTETKDKKEPSPKK